jgi:hypothetical protein
MTRGRARAVDYKMLFLQRRKFQLPVDQRKVPYLQGVLLEILQRCEVDTCTLPYDNQKEDGDDEDSNVDDGDDKDEALGGNTAAWRSGKCPVDDRGGVSEVRSKWGSINRQ